MGDVAPRMLNARIHPAGGRTGPRGSLTSPHRTGSPSRPGSHSPRHERSRHATRLGILAWAVAGAGMRLAYAPLSVATLYRAAAGREGRATSALQLCDVLGQALGTGVAGAIVAAAAGGPGRRAGVALAFSPRSRSALRRRPSEYGSRTG